MITLSEPAAVTTAAERAEKETSAARRSPVVDPTLVERGVLGRLEGELAEVCGQLNVLHARLVTLTAEALEVGAWAQWGIHTPSHWLAWKAGLSRTQARTVVRLAARRGELPVTMAAFDRGELSMDQVAPIVAKVPAWAEAEVCALAVNATVTQLRSVVSSYPFDAEVPPAEDLSPDVPARREEHLSLSALDGGQFRLSGLLDHDHGLLVEAALAEANQSVFRRTGSVASGVDALVELAHRSLDTVTEPGRRDRYRLHLHLDAAGGCTDARGRHVPVWMRRLAGCDATSTVIWEDHGRPVAVGPPQASIPAVLRRHVLRRDRGCRVPGCTSTIVDLHHVVHREDGGTASASNLVAVCPRHHRLHHQGQLGITGDAEAPGRLTFTDRHGHTLQPGPVARPPTRPPPQPAAQFRHPLGEKLQRSAVTFNRPRPTNRVARG